VGSKSSGRRRLSFPADAGVREAGAGISTGGARATGAGIGLKVRGTDPEGTRGRVDVDGSDGIACGVGGGAAEVEGSEDNWEKMLFERIGPALDTGGGRGLKVSCDELKDGTRCAGG
jgi:hypothetical protein